MKRLVELRKSMNLSQAELAENLKLSQQVVCRYELGQSVPDIDTLKRMAAFFDTTIDYLVGNDLPSNENHEENLLINNRPVSEKEIELILRYRKLPEKYRKDIDEVIDDFVKMQER